jgi:serine/threonine protein kinase
VDQEALLTKASWEFDEGHEIAPGRSVLKHLGGGNRYEVYLVWEDRLFAVMVAKVLRPDRAEDPDAVRGLEREAEALGRLAHPVLLRGFGAVLDGPYPHVLVEHLEGPTLHALIKRHAPLPMEQVLPLALHVAAVLHYLSTEEMVHLDVKPANVVMGLPPRLIDLSLARPLRRARRLREHVGTNAYMPPEQCAPGAAGVIESPADVWGLGATLYHAIAGRLPFPPPRRKDHEGELAERFPQLVAEPRSLPNRVPDVLAEQVLGCLRKDPAERPTATELAMGLEPLVASLPRKLVLGKRGARLA